MIIGTGDNCQCVGKTDYCWWHSKTQEAFFLGANEPGHFMYVQDMYNNILVENNNYVIQIICDFLQHLIFVQKTQLPAVCE